MNGGAESAALGRTGAACKSIVMPVSTDAPGESAAVVAAVLARRSSGVLRLLYPRGESVETARFRYPTLGESFFVQVEEASRKAEEARESEVRAAVEGYIASCWPEGLRAERDPPPVRWEPVDADPPEAIRLQGGLYDLLVADDDTRADREVIETALFQTGRPVLLVPDETEFPDAVGRRIAIGWNRSAEAGRAVVAALSLLSQAEEVVVCAVRSAAKQGPPPSRLVEYLGHHGIAAKIVRPELDGGAVGAALLRAVEDQGADLLVAGANYVSRQRSIAPGGVTGHLLLHTRLPVLMAH